jgi:hypothetical protein
MPVSIRSQFSKVYDHFASLSVCPFTVGHHLGQECFIFNDDDSPIPVHLLMQELCNFVDKSSTHTDSEEEYYRYIETFKYSSIPLVSSGYISKTEWIDLLWKGLHPDAHAALRVHPKDTPHESVPPASPFASTSSSPALTPMPRVSEIPLPPIQIPIREAPPSPMSRLHQAPLSSMQSHPFSSSPPPPPIPS